MKQNRQTAIRSILTDRFASEWKLLAETESFVSHTPEAHQYEAQFKDWRYRLQNAKLTDNSLPDIRDELVALRKSLRSQGYDLTLGLQRLVVRDFRNDDSLAQGFQRVVLCFCGDNVYFQTGSGNHVAIAEELLDTLSKRRLLANAEVHYLWYLRSAKGLLLSGSATETKEDFARLQDRADVNPLKMLSALRQLN